MKMKAIVTLLALSISPFLLSCSTEGHVETPVATASPTPNVTLTPEETRAPEATEAEAVETLPPTRYTSVSSGWFHTCALRDDGAAVCWGAGTTRNVNMKTVVPLGQANPPPEERFIAISSGYVHTCGLREDGRAVCWGSRAGIVDNQKGQIDPPSDERFVAISSGYQHTCGLRSDGTAACWGNDEFGQSTPPEGERLKAIATGGPHTCGLRTDDTIVCWGREPYREPLHGFRGPPGGEFSTIDASGGHTCGVRKFNGWPECWGSWDDIPTPGRFPSYNGARLHSISFSGRLGCGLRSDGSPYCWGDRLPAYPEDYKFSEISAGGAHICAIRKENGEMVCWGDDDYGQSTPPDGERFVWTRDGALPVEPFPPYIDVSSGAIHTCALRADGAAICWGAGKTIVAVENPSVHLGQSSPPSDERFVTISSGPFHTCGLRADGTTVCWGARREDIPGSISLRAVMGQSDPPVKAQFVGISSGEFRTCGWRENGLATCWGRRTEGERSTPKGERFKAIAVGRHHNCGLRLDNTVLCWGWEPDPDDSTLLDETPRGEFSALDAGGRHTCGLRSNGQVECWGYWTNEPPDYVPSYEDYPSAHIDGGLNSISVDGLRGCGLRSDGTAFCWGSGHDDYPEDIPFSHMSVGGGHTCAIRKDDGGLVCWGYNKYGQASPPGGETFEGRPR